MRAADIKQGHFYVNWNGALMRRVVYEIGSESLHWADYSLDRKQRIGSGTCSKKRMAQWAEREATPEEIAQILSDETR